MKYLFCTILVLATISVYCQAPFLASDYYPGSEDGISEWNNHSIEYDSKILIPVLSDEHGEELGVIQDGEVSLLSDINEGPMDSDPRGFVLFQDLVYFAAFDSENGVAIWRTDGTPEGTEIAVVPDPSGPNSIPRYLVVTNGLLYFTYDGNLLSFDGMDLTVITDGASFFAESTSGGKNFTTYDNSLYYLDRIEINFQDFLNLVQVTNQDVTVLGQIPIDNFTDYSGLSRVDEGFIFGVQDSFDDLFNGTYRYSDTDQDITKLLIANETKLSRRIVDYNETQSLIWIGGDGYYLVNGRDNEEVRLFPDNNNTATQGDTIFHATYNDNLVFHNFGGFFDDQFLIHTDGSDQGGEEVLEVDYASNLILEDNFLFFASEDPDEFEPELRWLDMVSKVGGIIYNYETTDNGFDPFQMLGVIGDTLYFIGNLDNQVGREIYGLNVQAVLALEDNDGDGFLNVQDCNDEDPTINPDAIEIGNNGIDEDCDGEDYTYDAGCFSNFDEFVAVSATNVALGQNPSWDSCEGKEIIHLGVFEECSDDPGKYLIRIIDADFNYAGYDISFGSYISCYGDTDQESFPNGSLKLVPYCDSIAIEGVDKNGDSYETFDYTFIGDFIFSFYWRNTAGEAAFIKLTREEVPWLIIDNDLDGFPADVDCDDDNASINPVAIDIPDNGIDEDCDGEDAISIIDNDNDGSPADEDCDDNNPDVNPDADEIPYNGIDDDCDPMTLDDDLDQDGYNLSDDCDDTNADSNPDATDIPDNGIDEDCDGMDAIGIIDNDNDGSPADEDCDDNNPDVNPDADEIPYNGIDDDCDPMTLDDDLDQDGYNLTDDCDDTNADINPDATDIPDNGIDEDCDGMDAIGVVDNDNDGSPAGEDCDDNNPDVNPDADEIPYNGVDDDCDPMTLDDDLDQDGYNLTDDCDDTNADINPDATDIPDNGIDEDCDGMDAIGVVDNDNDGSPADEDCDDNNPDVNPDADEIPYNGVDDDCDPMTLDDDLDQDGYNLTDDCDDTNADINPDAIDIPDNGIDEDCDGMDAIGIVDNDNDGYPADEDCDDDNPDVNPGAMEWPYNGIDEDCDPSTPDDDLDGDGFGLADDCNDLESSINPDAVDIPGNGIDEDCDGMDASPNVDVDNDGFGSDVDCDDLNADIYPGAIDIPDNGIDEDCDGMDATLLSTSDYNQIEAEIYPNPFTSELIIQLEEYQTVTASMIGIDGRLIWSQLLTGETTPLPSQDLTNGLYLIKLTNKNGDLTYRKVIKQ